MKAGHDRHHRAAKEGLLELQDTLVAVAQTPERICFCVQHVAGSNFIGPPEISVGDQASFKGRLKMYGDLREENVG